MEGVMKRLTLGLAIGLLAAVLLPAATSGAEKFVSASSPGVDAQGSLPVAFKIAGFPHQIVPVTAIAHATARWECVDTEDNPEPSLISSSAARIVGADYVAKGQVSGSITLDHPVFPR